MDQFIQKAKFEATELDGEWIILNTDQFTVTKLNEVGGFCWTLLNEVQTVESLTQSLLEKFPYNKNMNQMKDDIEGFLSQLLQCGLIQHVD